MLSKSQYTSYLQCPKLFWLSRKDKGKLTPPSAQLKKVFDTGTAVGIAAQQLFPGGTEVPFNIKNLSDMVRVTEDFIENGNESIYEASFIYDDIFVAVDILCFADGKWHIYEVKSSTEVKDVYLDDASVQYYVLTNSGIDVGSVNIVYINNKYIRGNELEITDLFSIEDITCEAMDKQSEIPHRISNMKMILEGDEPDIPIGPHCFNPYECSGYEYCWKTLANIPENSVFTLNRARIDKKFELYHSGIINISDVPLEERTSMQQLQILCKEFIDVEAIKDFISGFEYPIVHLDFETFQQAIPEYKGIKPYQQIPFQYSIHIEYKQELEHREFLAPVGVDPRRLLAERLIQDIPSNGTLLAYNRSFEIGVIRKLTEVYEDLSSSLNTIADRIEDLMTPFQKGWYYHPMMNGSYSIKNVLPALVPVMAKAYKELPVVHNGGEASAIWGGLSSIESSEEIERIRQGLLEYCKLDTLAMVKIFEVIRKCRVENESII